MGKIEQFVTFALNIAKDDSHGYDQIHRWGDDYDCSSLVITAVENAGIKVVEAGASYTGNMLSTFKKCGFKDVTKKVTLPSGKGLERGDILLNVKKHTAFYVGDGQLVHASLNEKGTISGGKKGDQTGKEICVRSYYNRPWDYVLRYEEKEEVSPSVYTVKKGDTLSAIAKKYNTTVSELVKLNGIKNPDIIKVGQKITLPSGKPAKEEPKTWKGKVCTQKLPLNIRKSSDPNSTVIGTLAKGSVHEFQGGAVNGMFKLASRDGWCSASYINKV